MNPGAEVSMSRQFRERVRGGEALLGTFLGLGSALAAEACALGGFEWLLVDLEHGGGSEGALVGQLLAAATHDVPVVVRVETGSRIRIGRALDLGAAGVMLPRLDSAEEVAMTVQYAYYPPEGERGVATYNRACDFGLRPEALDLANDQVVTLVQIETRPALEQIEAIARIRGVDVLFVGPRDLTHALGVPGQTDAPEFQNALRQVVVAARAAGVAPGILASSEQQARRYAEEGFTFIGVGSDASLLANAARASAAALGAPPGISSDGSGSKPNQASTPGARS
jgi:2-dehydro-3-deoxyglucarate aldolase/4-hydroxy-2-oxoheptanedioate aldolase